ncbi:MAG TPA: efflux RND transporter periplasmic adaptor subunit, partial [Vicinamibacterales bacterium]|nr:efflux RND transporter periplasmic adaptor subunit [Vicinamibacterales bacterium]
MQKKLILIIIGVGVIGASVWGYTKYKGGDAKPEVVKAVVTRGNIVEAVGATGTLEAVTTVQVGTQVSGTVQALYADFNQIVKKDQVIARLDPSLIQTQIEQQRANLVRAEADLQRLEVGLADAKVKQQRAHDLGKRGLIPATEVEAADVAVLSQDAQLRSSRAGVTQARANLNQQQVNLNHTVIRAPIDGIVISRNVDEGQTVAASMNAPVLFLLAADLTKMRVRASIDEADVGKIRPGQRVTFRVDAYPASDFEGTVVQVQLNPVVVQNVVTYATVIESPNPDLRLKPGMTATVNIEIARRDNVLRLPAGSLRFRPTADTFAALNQPVPEDLNAFGGGRGGRGGRGRGDADAAQPPAQPGAAPGTTPQGGAPAAQPQAGAPQAQRQGGGTAQGQTPQQRGGGDTAREGGEGRRGGDPNMTPEERQRRLEERMKTMTPEERTAFQERTAQRGQRGGGAGGDAPAGSARGQGAGQPAGQTARQGAQPAAPMTTGAQTIDALFAPVVSASTRGRVWMDTGTPQQPQLKALVVRTGITDGQWVELIEGELQEGQEVVTGVIV